MLHRPFPREILVFIEFAVILIDSLALFSSIKCFDLIFIIVAELSNMLSFRIIIAYESCGVVGYQISCRNVNKTRQLD